MLKLAMLTATAAVSFGLCANEPLALPQGEANAKRAQLAPGLAKTKRQPGSLVIKKAVGKVVAVNCQKTISSKLIAERIEYFRKVLRINFELVDGEPFDANEVLKRCRKLPDGAAAALYVVDDSSLPMSLSSIEEHWAVINVANLNDHRFARQFARGVTLAFGGTVSQFGASVMQPVVKPGDLDAISGDGLTVDLVSGILKTMKKLGVEPSRLATYRIACQEGWAAAPTNDFQKAVWEEVHAKPTKPMKIIFDPKKGE